MDTSSTKAIALPPVTAPVSELNSGKTPAAPTGGVPRRHINSQIERPAKELKDFKRVAFNAGETKTVSLTLPASRLSYWDIAHQRWSLEGDDIELQIGASSADIRGSKSIHVLDHS